MGPEVIVPSGFFFMVGFIVWISVSAVYRRNRLRALIDFNNRLIERIGSVSDFSEFANSDAGAKFLNSVMADAPLVRPADRIVRAVQIGVVLVVVSLGLLSLGWYFQNDAHDGFVVIGVLALSLGVGFLLSSLASYRVSASLGLLTASLATSK